MSFIMGSWCGLPKDRCPRCRKKPGYGSKDAMSYRKWCVPSLYGLNSYLDTYCREVVHANLQFAKLKQRCILMSHKI